MARELIVKGPRYVHPEKPGAVGSRNSMNRHGRDEYAESKLIVDEEVDKLLNHIHAKLPPEVLEKLDVMGSIKSKLHNYFNQEYQNMLNRYLVTMEDEMAKKVRDLVDKEEFRILNRYTPREVSELLDKIGGFEKFNTGEIEKSIVNMYGHLQGHIQRGMYDLETWTNAILREKSDVGAFVRGENSYAIIKCSFSDNPNRSKTVQDIKLSINILDSELISPIYHYQALTKNIVKDLVAAHVHELVDREINTLNDNLLDAGKEELTDSEKIFEKFKILENYVSEEDESNENSKRYQFVAKKFLDAIDNIKAEIDSTEYDALQLRENVKAIIDNENLRNRGYNTAINSLTSILDTSKMGYQFIENHKNTRQCVIREYDEEDSHKLPDERYAIKLSYYDYTQLKNLQEAFLTQINEFERTIGELWDLSEAMYLEYKKNSDHLDWDELSNKIIKSDNQQTGKGWFFSPQQKPSEEEEIDEDKLWNELTYISPAPTQMTAENPSFEDTFDLLTKKLDFINEKINTIYKYSTPEKRLVFEERYLFLKDQFELFKKSINPFHLLPGVLLEIDVTSIKKKRTTMLNMANVLNEFLFTLSKGFADEAFANFSRRRSTERTDLTQSFQSSSSV